VPVRDLAHDSLLPRADEGSLDRGKLFVVEIRIVTGGHWPDVVDTLLHDLPEWFGIEASVRAYVEPAHTLPGVAAVADSAVVGICLLRRHTDVAAEIELLAVRRDLHRSGIGRQLLARAEAELRAEG